MALNISTRGGCLIVALGVAAAVLMPGEASSECAWRPPESRAVGSGVARWYGDVADPGRKPAWSLSAGGDKVSIKLGEGADVAVVEVALAPDCTRSVSTTWPAGALPWFDDDQARCLVAGLGLESVAVKPGGVDGDRDRTPGPDPVRRMTPVDIALIVLSLGALLLAFVRRRDGRGPLVVDTILLAAMMLLAAWPIFPVPFSTDAHILRVAYAARDVFGDWNHPFLSYLLNRPSALLSNDPVVLRIVPFIWALLEAFLFSLAARKIAGRAAFVLVAIWMTSSLRLTMGMVDLSDWNLAGIFLALMVLWMTVPVRQSCSPKYLLAAAGLILAGCFSSYMMIVPATILTAVLVVDWRRGRVSIFGPATAALALLFAGYFVLEAFLRGATVRGGGFTQDLAGMLRDVFVSEPPFGLSILMPGLIVAGFFAGSFRQAAKAWWFCLATFLFSIGALALALVFSAINGAYYFAFCKGLAYLSAALLVVALVDRASVLAVRVQAPRWVAGMLVPLILALAVFAGTYKVTVIPRGAEVEGIEHLGDFVDRTGRGKTRVLSNDFNARVLLMYSEVMRDRMDIGIVLDDLAETWVHRTVSRFGVDEIDCSRLPPDFLLLWRNLGGTGTDGSCRPFGKSDCVELFVDSGMKPCPESKRAFCYYECHRMTEAGDDGGAR